MGRDIYLIMVIYTRFSAPFTFMDPLSVKQFSAFKITLRQFFAKHLTPISEELMYVFQDISHKSEYFPQSWIEYPLAITVLQCFHHPLSKSIKDKQCM